jgi:deoxyadenosine/deoxycytidine kinase
MYIAIAGNIGVGKSTLTQLLSERYHLSPVYEAVDENPYLEDFYLEMHRYAFHSQMFFLAKRLEQHLQQVNPGSRIIQDRTIYEDAAIFAQNLYEEGVMEERDYNSYCQMYGAIAQALRPPDLLVYLQASVPILKARIALRGRAYEQTISEAYLAKLNALYERWTKSYRLSPMVTIATDDLDFLKRPSDLAVITKKLEQHGLALPVL